MKLKWPIFIIICGVALGVFGFLYDAFFAGIPFQDPSPELEAEWRFHNMVSNYIIVSGLVILIIGALVGVLSLVKKIFN